MKTIKNYMVKITSMRSNEQSKSFHDIAKQHLIDAKGEKEDLASNMDKVLYGKQ